MFDEGTKRYRRDISKRDEVDDELDKMLASPPGSPQQPAVYGGTSGQTDFRDSFYPGQHKDSEEECSPSFRVTKKKRGKKALGATRSVYSDIKPLEEPDIDQEFMDDIERIRTNRNTNKYPTAPRADENV